MSKPDKDQANTVRIATVRECVTWLALNCYEYKTEFLAGEMARELIKYDSGVQCSTGEAGQ